MGSVHNVKINPCYHTGNVDKSVYCLSKYISRSEWEFASAACFRVGVCRCDGGQFNNGCGAICG